MGVATALDMLLGLDGRAPVIGLVGGIFSSICLPVSALAAVTQVPQICLGTSPAFSNKQEHPFFLRTTPSDVIQGKAFWAWLLHFEVPSAACIWGDEPYGFGLWLIIREEAEKAGQADRLRGVGLRNMPVNFVRAEAITAINSAKSFKSRVLFLSTNLGLTKNLLPVLEDEGMLQEGWQVLASEAATVFDDDPPPPVGMMRWKPRNRGPRFQNFLEHWSKMRVDDVLGQKALAQYKIKDFRMPLERATAPALTADTFADGEAALEIYASFAFDACYAFAAAISELLNRNTPLGDIRGEVLLNMVKAVEFEGTTGTVSFDENGDRKASVYELENYHPDGWQLSGVFSTAGNQLTILDDLYWLGGAMSMTAPARVKTCGTGLYEEEATGRCIECPKGFQCQQGRRDLCPKGQFSNTTGSASCVPCAPGSFSADLGATRCIACVAGLYAENEGMEACKRCPRGTYTPSFNSDRCLECGMGQETEQRGAQSVDECRCPEGSFMCQSACRACPEGLFCEAGLEPPVQLPGYWATEDGSSSCSFQVLRCRNALQCPSRSLGVCAEGRQGLACNNCKERLYPETDGTCSECGPGDGWRAPVALCSIFGICALLLVCKLFPSAPLMRPG